jgi:4-hydroxythreonine-4-phosphate dehydrogenase
MNKPIIGITMGDPNGIGLEVIMKCFSNNYFFELMTPVLFASPKAFVYTKNLLELPNINFNQIKDLKEAREARLNLIVSNNDSTPFTLGTASKDGGKEALLSIDKAIDYLSKGELEILVTAPIDKSTIETADFTGHTGYLASKLNSSGHLMILCTEEIRVGLVTEHLPLAEVAKNITTDLIVEKGGIFIDSLKKDFGIIKPKIAVVGLNPHAGDSGKIGDEETRIIMPAIEILRKETNALVFGPYGSDGLWGSKNFMNFDGILSMYHDQGLSPFKAIAFDEGVNYTAGLSIVRTSPDHGTAYDIAGKNIAEPDSFINALFMALKIYKTRKNSQESADNFLPFSELRRERFRLGPDGEEY